MSHIKEKAKQLKKQIIIVYLAYLHKDVKWFQRALLLFILIYAASPIDFIPDFIPVLGMLDDILLIPLGVLIAIKIIPKHVWEDCRTQAENGVVIAGKYKKMGVGFVAFLWGLILLFIVKSIL